MIGRSFIGIELDPGYHRIASTRLAAYGPMREAA
jgi:DNA modification methylase